MQSALILKPGIKIYRRADQCIQIGLHPDRAHVLPADPELWHCLQKIVCGDQLNQQLDQRLKPYVRQTNRRETNQLVAAWQSQEVTANCRLINLLSYPVDPFQLKQLISCQGNILTSSKGELTVISTLGETPREISNHLVKIGQPHLLLRLVDNRIILGPWVSPGITACLRCLDAHYTDADPSWPLLVKQDQQHASTQLKDGSAYPLDPGSQQFAAAWAVRDISAWQRGLQPSSWSSTIEIELLGGAITQTTWLRHPECGCAWDG